MCLMTSHASATSERRRATITLSQAIGKYRFLATEILMLMSQDQIEAKESYTLKTSPSVRTSQPTLCPLGYFERRDTIGITKAIITFWHERTTRSCARCRRFTGNKLLTTSRYRAVMPFLRVASLAVNAGSPGSLLGIRDQRRRQMPSCGISEWATQGR